MARAPNRIRMVQIVGADPDLKQLLKERRHDARLIIDAFE